MLDKSLFICYSTPNYSKLTNICLNSLHDINVNNIIFYNKYNFDVPEMTKSTVIDNFE